MNISGIRPEAGFYDNNSIKRVDNVADAVNSAQKSKESVFDTPAATVDFSDEGKARSKQTFGIYDYASQYKPGESFNMKGENSDIKSLDVERAVSDMKRDSVIQQYQFFVGSQNGNNADASIRGSEDFSL